MRWNTENENLLWRTIFQTQSLHLDLNKVSEAWPGDEKPTPKAIKEKLDKYRRSNASNSVTFSMGKNPSTPSPRKTRARKSTTTTATAIDTAATTSSPTPERKSGATAHRAANDASAAIPVTGSGTGDGTPGAFDRGFATGNGTGRGHGKSRKPRVMDDGNLEDMSGIGVDWKNVPGVIEPASKKIKMEAPEFEVQTTPPLFSTRARLENDKNSIGSGMKTANVGESKVKVEDTEVYYST